MKATSKTLRWQRMQAAGAGQWARLDALHGVWGEQGAREEEGAFPQFTPRGAGLMALPELLRMMDDDPDAFERLAATLQAGGSYRLTLDTGAVHMISAQRIRRSYGLIALIDVSPAIERRGSW